MLDEVMTKSQIVAGELVEEVHPGYRVTERQVETAIDNGVLTPMQVGNTRIFERSQVEQWLRTGLRPSGEPGRLRAKSARDIRREQEDGSEADAG